VSGNGRETASGCGNNRVSAPLD